MKPRLTSRSPQARRRDGRVVAEQVAGNYPEVEGRGEPVSDGYEREEDIALQPLLRACATPLPSKHSIKLRTRHSTREHGIGKINRNYRIQRAQCTSQLQGVHLWCFRHQYGGCAAVAPHGHRQPRPSEQSHRIAPCPHSSDQLCISVAKRDSRSSCTQDRFNASTNRMLPANWHR